MTPDAHVNRKTFLQRKASFEKWLASRGAEVLVPTNEYELCRFRTATGTSVVYARKTGALTWMGEAGEAFVAYQHNNRWRAVPATPRNRKSSPLCQALRQRDGGACFFCHLEVDPDDESPEHLVALTHGGPDHIANMALAHRSCNAAAGHLPLMEKIAIREKGMIRGVLLPTRESGEIKAYETPHAAVVADAIDDLFDRSEWPPNTETIPPWEK